MAFQQLKESGCRASDVSQAQAAVAATAYAILKTTSAPRPPPSGSNEPEPEQKTTPVGTPPATTFEPEDVLGPLGVGATAALLFWLLFRLPRRYAARRQAPPDQRTVWRRAVAPATTAVKVAVLLSVMSGIRTRHTDFADRVQVTFLFAVFLSIAAFVIVYIIALPICAATQRLKQTLQPTASRSDATNAHKSSVVRTCPSCDATYHPADYRPDATWYCSSCKELLPHEAL